MRMQDRAAVIGLLTTTQHWVPSALFERFFAWKHQENPFGVSPAWVATAGERLVGLRTYLRWEFAHPDGRVRRAVRAVDTATHPDFQGRGIFSRMTLQSIEQLRADGVDFIFNTPNEKSRPGYLKMGWTEVGRLRAAVRPRNGAGLVRMMRSRLPADRWSVAHGGGAPALEVLRDPRTAELLDELARPRGLRTRRTVDYLRWRYSFEPLAYRAAVLDEDPRAGVAVYRVRRRGHASEAALCELLVPNEDRAATRALEREVARTSDADYVLRLGGSSPASRFVSLPGQGPVLTWRDVAGREAKPPLATWQLQLGDIELF
jgi:hypothetical protein